MFDAVAAPRRFVAFRAAIVSIFLSLLLAVAPVVPGASADPPLPVSEIVEPVVPGAVTGAAPYPLGRVGCLGCAAGLLVAGGGTIIGVVAVATAVPHYFGWCAAGCYLAYR